MVGRGWWWKTTTRVWLDRDMRGEPSSFHRKKFPGNKKELSTQCGPLRGRTGTGRKYEIKQCQRLLCHQPIKSQVVIFVKC